MERIKKEQKEFPPDKVITSIFADPVIKGDRLKAPGAVFRGRGEWHGLKYRCETGPKHREVKAFDDKNGQIAPEVDGQKYHL